VSNGSHLEMNPTRTLLIAVLVSAFGTWIAWHLLRALRTGAARAGGTWHRRRDRPAMFWLTVGAQCFFLLACFVALYETLM